MSANALEDHLQGRIVTVVDPPERRRDVVVAGGLRLDPVLQMLGCGGIVVNLTATETALLHPLLLRAGTVVPQHELVAAAWAGNETSACKNRLYTHMVALRRKLARARAGATIETFRRGYRLVFGVTANG